MKSRWNDVQAQSFVDDPLQMRVYSSRLIGQDPDLVLHGGGNTSVKAQVSNLFGEQEEVLFVKGSGWDLATIEAPGFAPVRLDVLKRLSTLEHLSDSDMVKEQRAACLDPAAPNPSVEAILHAIIPFRYVDHSHADAVVTLSNNPHGERYIKEVYADRVLVIPYVMPGFVLAKKVKELSTNVDWSQLEGMVLLNHGIFSFADDAKTSYERMIKLVDEAEQFIQHRQAWNINQDIESPAPLDSLKLARLRHAVAKSAGKAMLSRLNTEADARGFAKLDSVDSIATRGPLTPDHVIRTKRIPLIVSDNETKDVQHYADQYRDYFNTYSDDSLSCLDTAPRWAVWPGVGTLAFGASNKETSIISDITMHTIRCIQWAEQLSSWQALPASDIFEVEYWELEQAKLRKSSSSPLFQGKVAIVTGAASGIGRACVEALHQQGAAIAALDISDNIETLFDAPEIVGIQCDVRDSNSIQAAIDATVRHFGGVDILISNAGTFPPSQTLENMQQQDWDNSIEINLSSHQRLLSACIPFLKLGLDPAIIVVGSKNVPAPGPGASAYSSAKAGLNQMVRIAAMELAEYGIRVNTTHPNAVFDTGIWTDEVLEKRAAHYGLSVAEYKTNNLLKTEVTSEDVARLVCTLAGPVFSKTTGAQIAIDGGNDRVI